MIGSLILNTVTRAAFPTVLVFSVYLLFAGHNAPGGGFIGGLVAGAALVLRYAGRGVEGLRPVLPDWLRFELLLGGGLLLAAVTVITPLFFGEAIFTIHHYHWEVPLLGEINLGTSLFFDTGVWLIVVGLVLGILEMLGGQPDRLAPGVTRDDVPRSGASTGLPPQVDGGYRGERQVGAQQAGVVPRTGGQA